MPMTRNNIGILTFPLEEAGNTPLTNLATVIGEFTDTLYVITGNCAHITRRANDNIIVIKFHYQTANNVFSRITNYLTIQLKMALEVWRLRTRVNKWIFFIGSEGLFIPMLTALILQNKVVIAAAGSDLKTAQSKHDPLSALLSISRNFNYSLSDGIILYSKRLIQDYGLLKYSSKIHIARPHLLDLEKFKIEKNLKDRDNYIGFIGRFSEEKGVLNFIKSIPSIVINNEESLFLVAGDGQLKGPIEEELTKLHLRDKTRMPGWIMRSELPKYLNDLKVLVVPSFTEGLPNIILEAMACGTIVLTTPVGAIQDVITNGVTGFLMENNTPECIANNLNAILKHKGLEKISSNARALVAREFNYQQILLNYNNVFQIIFGG